MDGIILGFLKKFMGENVVNSLENVQDLVHCMMSFVYAHRHNKDDLFLLQSKDLIDFTVLRDCMYHYSKKAQDRYFSQPIETYFFAKFAQSEQAQVFIKSKNNMSSENIRRLLKYT